MPSALRTYFLVTSLIAMPLIGPLRGEASNLTCWPQRQHPNPCQSAWDTYLGQVKAKEKMAKATRRQRREGQRPRKEAEAPSTLQDTVASAACGRGHKQKNCRRQVNAVEEKQQQQPPTDVGHLSATDSTSWIHTVVVDDRDVDESLSTIDVSPDDQNKEVDKSPEATEDSTNEVI
eukprot:2718588-Amphidinium_carterae.1